jgi:protein SCO1/2
VALAIVRRLSLLLALSLIPTGCGNSSAPKVQSSARSPHPSFRGSAVNPPFPKRSLILQDSLGNRVNLGSYRGKAVVVTFIYTHCPDICPLIVGHLHTVQEQLGAKAGRLQIVAVSVDPEGDSRMTVAAFLKAHQMTGRMKYLIGNRSQLQRVWKRWGVLSKADPKSPDAVEHSAEIFGISASGHVRTLYPATFAPADLVADVPKLAGL